MVAFVQSPAERYSASAVDCAIGACTCVLCITAAPPRIRQYPVRDLHLGSFAQFESQTANMGYLLVRSYVSPSSIVPLRYLRFVFRDVTCTCLGFSWYLER